MKLRDQLTQHFRLLEPQQKALKRLRIETIEDLLFHFPSRYGDTTEVVMISNLQAGETATIYGKIKNFKTGKTYTSKVPRSSGTLYDDSGTISVTWFNQPYLAKMIGEDKLVRVTGKVAQHKEKLTLNNPEIENVEHLPIGTGGSLFSNLDSDQTLFPVYPESRGITSKWMYHAIQKIFKSDILEQVSESIPEKILEKYNLPKLETALVWVHTPIKEDDALAARKRFAFEEIFTIQLQKFQERSQNSEKVSFTIDVDQAEIQKFVDRFPFELTQSQQTSIEDILKDFKRGAPMARLLEGDVGSGKTAVAAATIYAATVTTPHKDQDFGHLQTAYMVPTEILAKQHFQNFITFFEHLPISIGLITSSGCYKFPSKVNPKEPTKISRAQLLKWVANGEIPILIGTHSLIQKSVQFKNLAYIIIDEQHRFGTLQRQSLARKDEFTPHLLSMTATPIPRTLALTLYGDLDLTLLDQMPTGRKPIITELVPPVARDKTYTKVHEQLEQGRQVYVICPRIDEPDPDKLMALQAKSVKAEAKRLKKDVFQEYELGILHSKMTPKEKEEIMNQFESGDIDILVATSVVEVGVNVPNATVILLEGAERFGLSQLHQLRGRVIRSNHQAYCYVFSESSTQKTLDRLKALQTSKNGFELSEHDLKLRGVGELYGRKQWGVSDLAMEALQNIKMVEMARKEAQDLIEKDPELDSYPDLKKKVEQKHEVHFE